MKLFDSRAHGRRGQVFLALFSLLGVVPEHVHAQYDARYSAGVAVQPQVQSQVQLQYPVQPIQYPGQTLPPQAYCTPNTDVAPGTCICPGGTQFSSSPGMCSSGRCMCPAGMQWNGASCAMPPPPPPPPPPMNVCRVPCGASQVCVNGVCVGTGDLRFTLTWDRPGDMDLHVVTPRGNTINYRMRNGDSGTLDRDDRTGTGPENIYWASSPPPGTYLVCVDPYAINVPTNFTLTVVQSGQAVRTLPGSRTSAQRSVCGRGSANFVTEITIAQPTPSNVCPPFSMPNPATGRCECQAGTQWNGSACVASTTPAVCPYACAIGTTCIGGQCVATSTPGNVRWVPASNGYVPPGAVQGGNEQNGQPLFVCRAQYNGGVHIGKVVGQACNFGWGGAEVTMPQYEVLTGIQGRWVPGNGGYVPPGALQGGNEATGQPLYICRSQYRGGVHVGKVVGQNCNFGWGGAEITMPQYEVLVP